MTNNTGNSFFRIVLNFAVGAMLIVGGIWAFQGGGDFGCRAIKSLFASDVAGLVTIIFGVVELFSGAFIIFQLFIGDKIGSFGAILKLIVIIVWLVAIVIADFMNNGGAFQGGTDRFLNWLYDFAMHLIVLCALFNTKS